VRDRAGLQRTRERLDELAEQAEALSVPGGSEANPAWQEALDLRNHLTVARVIVASALAREESRGAHFRSDFPERDDERWLRSAVARTGADGAIELEWRPVELTRARPPQAAAS
jgi:succinate dehydrogenase/fumarate reductase flavoprotein subunit